MDTRGFLSDEVRLEENFRASEALISNDDNVAIRKFVGLLKGRGLRGSLHFSIEIKSNIGELLLDITNNFTLSSGGEGVTALGQDLHEVISQVTASQVQTNDSMRKSVTFVDRNSVGNTITGVQNASGGSTRGIEGQNGLDVDIHGRDVEGLEHDLGHAFTVGLWVQRSLSQQDRVFLRSNTKLVVEGVMPDLLHIIPVGDNTVLNWVLEGKNTTLGLGFVSDVSILLVHANHDSRVLRSAYNRRKDSARGIVTGETSLAHSGAVINDQSLNILVRHDYWVCVSRTNTAELVNCL
mmetsp:Transcript_2751/g.1905  ORF Transcript_2751/g.1905 Transcript_2751/m.1905 type:complete len:295 (+) Transcript_2751:509-1393(+)